MPLRTLLCLLLASTTLVACDEEKDTGEVDDTAETDDTGEVDDTGETGETGTTDTPDVGDLVDPGGCGDMMLTLASSDRSTVLAFQMSKGLTREAYENGGKATATLTLPDDGTLSLHRGDGITELFCNDVFTDTIVIDETWEATAGEVTITVVSEGIDHGHAIPGTATITIDSATLQLSGSEDITIEALSWEAAVGWLPG